MITSSRNPSAPLEIDAPLWRSWRLAVPLVLLWLLALTALLLSGLSLIPKLILALALLAHGGWLAQRWRRPERLRLRASGELWLQPPSTDLDPDRALRLRGALALGPWLLVSARSRRGRAYCRVLHRREQPELWRHLRVLSGRILGG